MTFLTAVWIIQFSPGIITQFGHNCEDDDGYIGLLLWNEKTQESTFAAYDAPRSDGQEMATNGWSMSRATHVS